jgi:hypothetical protein
MKRFIISYLTDKHNVKLQTIAYHGLSGKADGQTAYLCHILPLGLDYRSATLEQIHRLVFTDR